MNIIALNYNPENQQVKIKISGKKSDLMNVYF